MTKCHVIGNVVEGYVQQLSWSLAMVEVCKVQTWLFIECVVTMDLWDSHWLIGMAPCCWWCIFVFVASKDAEPTEPEKSAHDQVAGVLKKAGEIEERLRCYQGAGEPIRQVQQLVR